MRFLRKLSLSINNIMSSRIVNASAERNKKPILEIVQQYFKDQTPGNVLEISSGTGQHISFIAPHFPLLTFQPSEYDITMIPQIKLYIENCPVKNIKLPLHIDVRTPHQKWGLDVEEFDYILNINMIHISPFTCTEGLFKAASNLLVQRGLLITYGAYGMNGRIEPVSNINFDKFLRDQNPEWGVRDIHDLENVAAKHGLELRQMHDMPANNKCLVWEKL